MNQKHHNQPARTLQTGVLAYLDCFTGMIPCKVVAVVRELDYHYVNVTIKLTASRGAYHAGEVLNENSLHVVPRDCVIVRKGCSTRIIGYETRTD